MHLVGFIIRIYYDARSPERQITLSSLKCFIPVCPFIRLLFFHVCFISSPNTLFNIMILRILHANKLHGTHTVFLEKFTYSEMVNKFPPILNQKFHYRVVCWRLNNSITLFIKAHHCSCAVPLAFNIYRCSLFFYEAYDNILSAMTRS